MKWVVLILAIVVLLIIDQARYRGYHLNWAAYQFARISPMSR